MDGICVMKQSFWAVKKGKFLRMGKEQGFLKNMWVLVKGFKLIHLGVQ